MSDMNEAAQAFQQQQQQLHALQQNVNLIQQKPVSHLLKPTINVSTNDATPNPAFIFLVHSSATLNRFTNEQTPIPSAFTNSPTCKVKFSDVNTLKGAFTSAHGFKFLRASRKFLACIVVLDAQDDNVVNSLCTWLHPLLLRDFEGIPLVVGLPDKINGTALQELRNTHKNVAFVDNRANTDLFQKCQKTMAYAGAMIKNVQPQDGEIIIDDGCAFRGARRGRGSRGRGRGGHNGGGKLRGGYRGGRGGRPY